MKIEDKFAFIGSDITFKRSTDASFFIFDVETCIGGTFKCDNIGILLECKTCKQSQRTVTTHYLFFNIVRHTRICSLKKFYASHCFLITCVNYRYIRDGIDNLTATEHMMWQRRKQSSEDVSRFFLFNRYVQNYTKAIYFCSRRLRPSFGPFSTIYTMQDVPCYSGWRLQYYLYGSNEHQYVNINENERVVDTKEFYVGMSIIRPHHSRITFNAYATRFTHSTKFIVYGFTTEVPPVPTATMQATSPTTAQPPRIISACQASPLVITSVPVTITSPNYPDNYPNRRSCQWLVTLAGGNITAGNFDIN